MSSRPCLAFERLDIRRMPGIESGFSVSGLLPGVNVIYGPNGSGKTSLTRAVEKLLWRRAGPASRSIVNGGFNYDNRSWQVAYDAGHHTCQVDGLDTDFPQIDAVDISNRYLLALHDLLRADDQDFAAAILRESTGGYDINQAAGQLSYAAKPSAPYTLERTLSSALRDYSEALRQQNELRAEERQREELLESQQAAQAAVQQVVELERVRDYHRAVIARDNACRTLESFPAILARLTGNELDELARLRERKSELDSDVQNEQQKIKRARVQQADTKLAEPLSMGAIARLRDECKALWQLELERNDASKSWDLAEAKVATTRSLIGPEVEDAHLMAFDASQVDRLAGLMRESQAAHARVAALQDLAGWIPAFDPDLDLAAEREKLAVARRCLTNWLRQSRGEGPTSTAAESSIAFLLLAIAGLATFEALLLAVLVNPLFLALLVPALVLSVLGLWILTRQRTSPSNGATQAEHWRAEYLALGLEAPARWEARAVEAHADALSQRQLQIQSAQEWQHVLKTYPVALEHAERIDAQVAEFARVSGIATVKDVAALHNLAHALVSWQRARVEADAARARLVTATARYDAALASINREMVPHGYQASYGHASANVAIEHLAQRESERAEAEADERRGESQIAGPLQQQLDRWQTEFNDFFARFELQPDDEFGLRSLLERRPDFTVAKQVADRATLEVERAQRSLGESDQYLTFSAEELDEALHRARDESARLDGIRDQIAAIDARIRHAKHGSSVEQALAAQQAAADALRDAREQSQRQVSGWALAEFVSQQTRDVDRPRVFHRARELFARITQGRYELHVDGTDQPTFRARDTETGTGHALDELSSGTRLQLLLAVRVAFVEQQERGPMLPLILDETLGNSDEHRARAIIDATIQIARDGRQVLYLTAQHDEVHKWAAVMHATTDVPFTIVDLAEVRGLADWERLPQAPPQSWVVATVPPPNGHSREAYGQLLHVPGIDLAAVDLGSVHLWHLIDDLETLHKLLASQIETWGQLRTLVEYGGMDSLALPPDISDCCRARLQVIGVIAEAWRVGKGRPVDRSVLLESGVVSDVFIDRVVDLTDELGGEGEALIAALEAGRISRFHTNTRVRLNDYLEANGYIDRSAPLTIADARARVLAIANSAIADGLLTIEWVNRTLAMLWNVDPA